MNSLRGITQRTLTYSDENHFLTSDSTNYQYDADGSLVAKTNNTDITARDYSTKGELLKIICLSTMIKNIISCIIIAKRGYKFTN